MTVIDLASKKAEKEAPLKIWICNCGCSSWALRSDGHVQCCNCESISDHRPGGWYPDSSADDYEGVLPFSNTLGNGDISFARARMARVVQQDGVMAAACVREDGSVSTWNMCEGEAQLEWLGRRLDQIRALWLAPDKINEGENA